MKRLEAFSLPEKFSGRKIEITRTFDAPPELLWQAWTDEEFLRRWWGPRSYTTPVSRIDLRVGGSYLNCMRSPEGKDYWSTGVYLEIHPFRRIVATDAFADEDGNVVPAADYGMPGDWPEKCLITVTFEEANGKTRMSLIHVGIPLGKVEMECRAGWNESFDKLAEEVELAEVSATA